ILSPAFFVSPEIAGAISLAIAIEQVLISIIGFSQQTVVLRYFSSFRRKIAQLYSASSIIVISATGVVFIVYVLSLFLPFWIPGVNKNDVLLLIISGLFQGIFLMHLAWLRGNERVGEYGIFRILYPVIKLPLFIIAMLLFRASIAYPFSILLANIALFIALAVKNRRVFSYFTQSSHFLRNVIRKDVVKQNIKMGSFLTLQAGIGVMYSVIDRFILQFFFNPEQVGIYHFAITQGTACIFFLQVLSLAYVPRIYQGDIYTPETARLLRNFLRIAVASSLIVSVIIYFVVFPLSLNFVNSEYRELYAGGRMVVALALLATIIDPIRLYGTYKLIFLHRVAVAPLITLTAFISRAVLGVIFVPRYGISGAAIAILLSVILNGSITVAVANAMAKKAVAKHADNGARNAEHSKEIT
ncbi:MAG: oligosaccharide flippase family protein, partial [Salinispira sp.]